LRTNQKTSVFKLYYNLPVERIYFSHNIANLIFDGNIFEPQVIGDYNQLDNGLWCLELSQTINFGALNDCYIKVNFDHEVIEGEKFRCYGIQKNVFDINGKYLVKYTC